MASEKNALNTDTGGQPFKGLFIFETSVLMAIILYGFVHYRYDHRGEFTAWKATMLTKWNDMCWSRNRDRGQDREIGQVPMPVLAQRRERELVTANEIPQERLQSPTSNSCQLPPPFPSAVAASDDARLRYQQAPSPSRHYDGHRQARNAPRSLTSPVIAASTGAGQSPSANVTLIRPTATFAAIQERIASDPVSSVPKTPLSRAQRRLERYSSGGPRPTGYDADTGDYFYV